MDNYDPYNRDDDGLTDTLAIQNAVQESISHPLIIAAPVFPPYTYPCVLRLNVINMTLCQYPGIAAEILHYAMQSANLSYTMVPLEKVDSWGKPIGRDPDTNIEIFDGLLGDLINGTYTTVMTSWGMTDIRMAAMDYTFPIENIRSDFGYIMRKPHEIVDINYAQFLFIIFPVSVWCMIAAMTITTAVIIWFSERLNPGENHSIFESFWRSLIMLFHQVEEFPPRAISSTIITVFMLLGLMFLHKIYEAYLVEQLAKQTHYIPFISMTQLAGFIRAGRYKLITYDLSDFYFLQVQYGEGPSFSAMRKALAEVPPIVEPRGMAKIIERLNLDPSLVLPGINEINSPNIMNNQCDLFFILDKDMSSSWGSFLFQKRAAAGMAVSNAMSTMIDFMVYIGEKYYAYQSLGDSCDRSTAERIVGSQPLKVEHYLGLILIVIVSTISSFVILAIECWCYRSNAKKTSKV